MKLRAVFYFLHEDFFKLIDEADRSMTFFDEIQMEFFDLTNFWEIQGD
ncbi:hypothetical protein ACE1CA_32085 [Aerosakkonemataceae cyanobacterium BLCC-F167]|uniref:Uncharacterized protein n=1 Tax=Floridaenema evergladense BLCC-F167 TaxID=3153639 RepID=A0ABV4WWC0_9CYAN